MGIKEKWGIQEDSIPNEELNRADEGVWTDNSGEFEGMEENAERTENSGSGETDNEAGDGRKPSSAFFPSFEKGFTEHLPAFMKGYFGLVLLLCILVIGSSLSGERRKEKNNIRQTETAAELTVPAGEETEITPESEASKKAPETETKRSETEAVLPPEDADWKGTIFGKEDMDVAERQIFITGLTGAEKEKLSFRESSFMKAVSAFLSSERIDVRTVRFVKKAAVSPAGAAEYIASLPGHDNLYLTVLMYPEYPGRYILSLLNLGGLTEDPGETERSEAASSASSLNRPQVLETQPSPVPATNTYDASRLSVLAVPSTLVNYLDNRYELQYTLYDFLYRNGKSTVASASVISYSIDPDNRTATIMLNLDDGSVVTGTYRKDENSYSYSY